MIANALTRSSSSMASKSSRPPRQCYAGLVNHPRAEQLLELADLAIGDGLMDFQRPVWRELVTDLLGSIRKDERRQQLRAPLELLVATAVTRPEMEFGLKRGGPALLERIKSRPQGQVSDLNL